MKILDCYGNDYMIGQQIGSHFKEILQAEAAVYENELKKDYIAEYIDRELDIVCTDMPRVYDELRGRSKGSELSLELITLMTSKEILRIGDGCTTIIVKQDDGSVLFSHNEDDDDFTSENSAVIVYHYNDLDVYAYTNAFKLPGSAVGWNSAGMVFSSNYLFYEETDLNSVSRYIAPETIFRSRSKEEAVGLVRNMKTASPFSFNIFDTNAKEAVNIEKDLDACYITDIRGKYSRSNHFLNKEATSSVSSDFRLNKTRELLQKKRIESLKDISDILDFIGEDREHTVHFPKREDAGDRTVINLSCDSEAKVVTIRNFLDDSVHQFRL